MARRTVASKHLAILALGTFIVLLGAIISAVGAFRSVMHDPKGSGLRGPYTAVDTNAQSRFNYRHYVALIAYYPEIFDCRRVKDIYQSTASDPELFLADNAIITAANFYCWRESGDAVWLYAFGFVILFVFLILGFTAAFRASGHQAALGGVGFSAVILTWTLLTIVHYQEHNNIPRALNAFGDCKGFASLQTSRDAFAPWSPANTITALPDFGLEAYPNYNAFITAAQTTSINIQGQVTNANVNANQFTQTIAANPLRAFYYSRRGGSDTLDEFTAAPAGTTFAFGGAAPTNFGTTISSAATTTVTGTVVSTVVATTVPTLAVSTRHGSSDFAPYTIDFNRSPARVFGPTPRRAWLCNDDWAYDGVFRVSQNLVYGGLATVALGALIVLTAFGYLAYPILGVQKFPKAEIQQQRASHLAEDLSEDSYYGESDF